MSSCLSCGDAPKFQKLRICSSRKYNETYTLTFCYQQNMHMLHGVISLFYKNSDHNCDISLMDECSNNSDSMGESVTDQQMSCDIC